ncbi:MAG: DUF3822 family protein [Bacteroidota bacterium]|nr:DUF3822 family protein [Bacteroidota bacterium]
MSKLNSEEVKLFILESEEKILSFYYSLKENRFKKTNIKAYKIPEDKWKSVNFISITNNFNLSPKNLPELFEDINLEKTFSDYQSREFVRKKIGDINLMYKADNLKHNTHISEILISEFLCNKSTKKEIFILFINKKIIITVKERKKLLFYNQFEYTVRKYVKYILLVMDEYKIDRTSISLIPSPELSNNHKKELDNFFKKTIIYKKSIFELTNDYYE